MLHDCDSCLGYGWVPKCYWDIGMGMGDGAITKILLQDAKLDVTGIDNEPKMIEQARKALRASIEQPVGDQDPAVAARNSAATFSSS